jgi:protocatechuate 3,4-dioxygenase beta subunit
MSRARDVAIGLAICFTTSIADAQTPTPPPAAAPPAAATIRGHVVAADSGLPLRKAEVRLIRVDAVPAGVPDGARRMRAARTDADGKYEFAALAGGQYRLTAAKAPYVEQTWGQTQPNAVPRPLDVHAGEAVDRVDFSLRRGGVVTGRVVDEFGEPVADVQMQAVQVRNINGRRDLQESAYGLTDDLGEFRMFGIRPGQYYVKAIWRDNPMAADPASPNRTGYADTFFPGTVNVDDAQRLSVRAGETIADVSMSLSPVRAVRIEGSVTDGNGTPLGGIAIVVIKGDGRSGGSYGGSVRPDGTFVIGRLTPGEYTLRAQSMPPRKETASLKLTVGTEDLKDVRLIAAPPSTVSGRVIVDPAEARSLPPALTISLTPSNGDFFMGMQPVRLGDDLSFELSAGAGRYRINWMNLPPGWMVRTIRINNTEVTDDDIEVKAGENISGVDIELTNKTATVAGTVIVRSGVPSTDYRVIVFAADKKFWTPNSRYFRTGGPDKDGRFNVAGLPPGNYNVVALERVEMAVPFNDAEFLQRISANADTITLADGESRTIELRLTSFQP